MSRSKINLFVGTDNGRLYAYPLDPHNGKLDDSDLPPSVNLPAHIGLPFLLSSPLHPSLLLPHRKCSRHVFVWIRGSVGNWWWRRHDWDVLHQRQRARLYSVLSFVSWCFHTLTFKYLSIIHMWDVCVQKIMGVGLVSRAELDEREATIEDLSSKLAEVRAKSGFLLCLSMPGKPSFPHIAAIFISTQTLKSLVKRSVLLNKVVILSNVRSLWKLTLGKNKSHSHSIYPSAHHMHTLC